MVPGAVVAIEVFLWIVTVIGYRAGLLKLFGWSLLTSKVSHSLQTPEFPIIINIKI